MRGGGGRGPYFVSEVAKSINKGQLAKLRLVFVGRKDVALLTGNAYELIAELKVQGYLMPFWTEQAAITFALAKVEAGRNVQRLTEEQSNIRPSALKTLVVADARGT